VLVDMTIRKHDVFVRVRDDGEGVPVDFLPHLLEAFHAGKDPVMRRERGLGLGLSIASHIVSEHRGTLRVDSAGPGRGTTITMELPVAEPGLGQEAVGKEREERATR
jgi:C4-dicarboxylate-specific signal transduction histidine kinase